MFGAALGVLASVRPSYKAAKLNLALGCSLLEQPTAMYPVANEFAIAFAEFQRRVTGRS